MNIKSLVIVGGGSSGWMTAAALTYKFPQLNITLIESEKISTIGVGESTLGHINRFMNFLDIKDRDFMPYCQATYKNSIQFTDFYKKQYRFQYPFGKILTVPDFVSDNGEDLDMLINSRVHAQTPQEFYFLKILYEKEISFNDFSRYFNFNSFLAEYNKQTDENIEGFNFKDDTAYHLDATKFGDYLKNTFCKNITHIQETVTDIKLFDEGIEYIKTNDKTIKADLFIDCSGFSSILIDKFDNPYYNFKNLVNDGAIVAQTPNLDESDRRKNIRNVTDCKGMKEGWMWTIPLWNRTSNGYVYSSKFSDKETIEREFRTELNYTGDIKHVKFKHGCRKKSWIKNVVSIGLSYGFIEPLESTGLFTTHDNILKLVELLGMHDLSINQIDKQIYNDSIWQSTNVLADFVAAHYAFSRRTDTEYWDYVTQKIDYECVDIKIPSISDDIRTMLSHHDYDYQNIEGFAYILAGMHYSPTNYEYMKWTENVNDTKRWEKLKNNFKLILQRRKNIVSKLEDNYDFLKEKIYGQYN
jgi:tryptophan halogenase